VPARVPVQVQGAGVPEFLVPVPVLVAGPELWKWWWVERVWLVRYLR